MRKIIFLVLSMLITNYSVVMPKAEKVSETPKGLEELFDELKSDNLNEIGEAASEIGKIGKHTFDNNLWIKHKTIHNLIVALYKVEHRFSKNASKEDVKKKEEVKKQITEALRNITGNTKAVTSNQWDEYMEGLGKSFKYMSAP
ncbi:MAG: hypothetical protein KAR43_13910 [Deltaproteobacteria bacterium]|nr:hypothetical protein [Deltaproteobacteria bacterium]